MTGHQRTVLWMGLILILLNLVFSTNWKTFVRTVFGPLAGGTAKQPSGKGQAKEVPGSPIPTLPFPNPFIPIGLAGTTPSQSTAGSGPVNA